jgi:hypothetical protein
MYTLPGYSDIGSFKQYPVQMGDQDADHPGEYSGTYTDSVNKIVLQDPKTDCLNTGPASTNACVFTTSSATQDDDHNIRFTFRNWGGRCLMSVNMMVYPLIQVQYWSDLTPWSVGSPFIVTVPEDATSATVFGKLNGANIFFTPSDPLSQDDAKNFTLVDKKVIDGFGTIYRFEINTPKKKSGKKD